MLPLEIPYLTASCIYLAGTAFELHACFSALLFVYTIPSYPVIGAVTGENTP